MFRLQKIAKVKPKRASEVKYSRLGIGFEKLDRAVFDLGGISFMDSTGIGFLIGRYKKFRRYGIPVYVTNPSLSTDRILQMSGVYTLIPKI